MTNGIILSGVENALVRISDNLIEEQNKLCALADGITKISNAQDQENAVRIASDIKAFMNEVEAARKELKKPIIDIGKTLDETVKTFVTKTDISFSKVMQMLAVWQQAEQVRAQRIRDEEEAKRREALRLAAEQEAELNRKKEQAKTEMEKEALEIELEKKGQEFRETIIESHAAVAVAAPTKAKGMSVAKVYDFEVEDIHKVYQHNSALVKLEANTVVIKSLLRQGMKECPGLKIFEAETKVNVRASK